MIEKNLHQIWVGPKPAPVKWMKTWQSQNPDWNYTLWDNDKVWGRDWINKPMMEYYAERGRWEGVADLARYEILYLYGGIMPGADSECLQPIDELFDNQHELFAVHTKGYPDDWVREDGKEGGRTPVFLKNQKEKSITPIYACARGNSFVWKLITELKRKDKETLEDPWITTGNKFCSEMLDKYNPRIKLFPIYNFIQYYPKTGGTPTPYKYIGNGKVYANHHWGTTRRVYAEGVDQQTVPIKKPNIKL